MQRKVGLDWAADVVPGYTEIIKRRVLGLLAGGPRATAEVMAEAGVRSDDYGKIVLCDLLASGEVEASPKRDVMFLSAKRAEFNPLAAVIAAEVRCKLVGGGEWVLGCNRCSAGWIIKSVECDSEAGAAHLRSVLLHVASHAGGVK